MKSILRKNYLLIIFYIIEAFLYASFLVLDFYNVSISEYLKYSSILLCLVASLIIFIRKKSSFCMLFTFLALFFTCVSDYFLLLAHDNSNYIIGVFTFFIVQILYFIVILKRRNFSKFKIELFIRLGVIFLIIFISTLIKENSLTIVALSYFSQLFINFISSLFLIKKNKKNAIFSIALFLFICCDIFVGLNNLSFNNQTLTFVFYYLMWLFYLPSQAILSTNSYFLE